MKSKDIKRTSEVSAKHLQEGEALVSDSSNLEVSIEKHLDNFAFGIGARIALTMPKQS